MDGRYIMPECKELKAAIRTLCVLKTTEVCHFVHLYTDNNMLFMQNITAEGIVTVWVPCAEKISSRLVLVNDLSTSVKNFKDGEATIKLKENMLTLSSSNVRIKLNTVPTHDQPINIDKSPHAKILCSSLKDAITCANECCGTENFRFTLTGAQITLTNKTFMVAATDSRIISITKHDIESDTAGQSVISPATLSSYLSASVTSSKHGEQLGKVAITDRATIVTLPGSQLILHNYISPKLPPFEIVANTNPKYQAWIPKDELLDALKQADHHSDVAMLVTLSKNKVKIEAQKKASSMEAEIKCIYSGENMTIKIKAAYLMKAVSIIHDKQCFLMVEHPEKLVKINSDHQIFLIMPMKQ